MALSQDQQDLDETRRLLYMALLAPRTKRYNLAGTLVNALRHHQGIDDVDLEDNVVMLINDQDEGGLFKLKTWTRERIAEITGLIDQMES